MAASEKLAAHILPTFCLYAAEALPAIPYRD